MGPPDIVSKAYMQAYQQVVVNSGVSQRNQMNKSQAVEITKMRFISLK